MSWCLAVVFEVFKIKNFISVFETDAGYYSESDEDNTSESSTPSSPATPRANTPVRDLTPRATNSPRVSPLRGSPAPPGESPCYTQPNQLRVRSGLTSSTRCVAPLHPAPTPQLFTCCNAIVAVTLNRRRTNSVQL